MHLLIQLRNVVGSQKQQGSVNFNLQNKKTLGAYTTINTPKTK